MQIAAIVQLLVQTVQYHHLASKKVIIHSDNASGFASQELIPFILDMKNILRTVENMVSIICIFTEA